MRKFMVVLRGNPDNMDNRSQPGLASWVDELCMSGNFVTGERLGTETRTAVIDNATSSGPVVTLPLCGYFIISATGFDQAVQIASECPVATYVEVCPVTDLTSNG